MPQTHPGSVDHTRSAEEQFLHLLLADEELLRAEFDAIIARSGLPATEPAPPTRLRQARPRRETPEPSNGDQSAYRRLRTRSRPQDQE